MSYISPINLFSSKNSYMQSKKQTPAGEKAENKPKKAKETAKKIIIGTIATAVFIEFMTNRFPQRKAQKQIYESVFSNLDEKIPDCRRNWKKIIPALSDREEIIITEAAKGNKTAEKLMEGIATTEKKNPEGIKKYIQARQKYENLQSYINNGLFDNLKRKRDLTIEDTKRWLASELTRLQRNVDRFYQEFIVPLN